ncbi:MAG: phosphoribosylglycinamide synthetase C domain-containing protein [Chloroflexia bacterium]
MNERGEMEAVGGRVFTAVGMGEGAAEARGRAYDLAAQIKFDGAWYRSDIGR